MKKLKYFFRALWYFIFPRCFIITCKSLEEVDPKIAEEAMNMVFDAIKENNNGFILSPFVERVYVLKLGLFGRKRVERERLFEAKSLNFSKSFIEEIFEKLAKINHKIRNDELIKLENWIVEEYRKVCKEQPSDGTLAEVDKWVERVEEETKESDEN